MPRNRRLPLVSDRSVVAFRGSSSVHPISFESTRCEGWVEVDDPGAEPTLVAGELTIPVTSLQTGQAIQDIELRRQLAARQHPAITATMHTSATDGDGRVAGDITFLGVTRPAAGTISVLVDPDSEAVRLTGSATFDVRDHGMKPPRVFGLRVHPEVTVTIDLTFAPPVGAGPDRAGPE